MPVFNRKSCYSVIVPDKVGPYVLDSLYFVLCVLGQPMALPGIACIILLFRGSLRFVLLIRPLRPHDPPSTSFTTVPLSLAATPGLSFFYLKS